jgi:hypothetical protein
MGKRPLEEVIEHCHQHGVKLNRTYLSKLRTGARPAPADMNLVRLLAEACGRDPEPLVTLAQYERDPQSVLLNFADGLAFADRCVQLLQGWFSSRAADVITRLEAGENVSKAEILEVLKAEDPVTENLRKTYHLYRDWVFDEVDRITDWGQKSMGPIFLEDGRFDQSTGFPEEMHVALRPREARMTKARRFRDLVTRLSELTDIPEQPIVAAIAAAKAVKDPDFDMSEFVQSNLRP